MYICQIFSARSSGGAILIAYQAFPYTIWLILFSVYWSHWNVVSVVKDMMTLMYWNCAGWGVIYSRCDWCLIMGSMNRPLTKTTMFSFTLYRLMEKHSLLIFRNWTWSGLVCWPYDCVICFIGPHDCAVCWPQKCHLICRPQWLCHLVCWSQ